MDHGQANELVRQLVTLVEKKSRCSNPEGAPSYAYMAGWLSSALVLVASSTDPEQELLNQIRLADAK